MVYPGKFFRLKHLVPFYDLNIPKVKILCSIFTFLINNAIILLWKEALKVKKEKNKIGLIILVVILFILVLEMGGYIIYDKFLSNNSQSPVTDNNTIEDNNANETVNQNNTTTNNTQEETIEKHFYDIKDLKVKALPEYQIFADISKNTNVVEAIDFGFEKNYRATLDLSGNVTVLKHKKSENEKAITGKLNVTGVIDIVQFDVPAMETDQLLYLLTDDGSVYCYRIGDVERNSFDAVKVEAVSNVKKIFISNFSKENAGGSWALFAITADNDCIMIDGESV